MQMNVVAQLRGDVDAVCGLLEVRVRFVRRRFRVVLDLCFRRGVREGGGELLPETLRNSIEWVAITWFWNWNCERKFPTQR